MFSKLTLNLAVAMSLMLASNAFAQQTKKADPKKTATTAKASADAQKAAEDKAAADAAAAKALEAKRLEEAKIAADKAKAEDEAGIYGYIKSHFSASYHGEYYFQRRMDDFITAETDGDATTIPNEKDKDIQDLRIMHNPTLIYRPLKDWKFLATSEFKYTDAATQGTFINRHYRSLILLTRENVLTEKENGIKMDIGIGRRIADRNHGAAGAYGNNRVNTSLSKKFFGDKLATSMLIQYLGNVPAKGKVKATTWKHSMELIPSFTWQMTEKLSYFFNDDLVLNSPWQHDTDRDFDISHEMNIGVVSYQFNDKQSAYFQFKYLHFADAPFQKVPGKNDWFEYYIGYTYSITPKFSITPEIGSEIFRGADGRAFFSEKVKYPEFALYVDYAL